VLHCFTKTTNQTVQSDSNIARDRLKVVNSAISDRQRGMKYAKGKKPR